MDYPVFVLTQLPQQLQALRKSRGWSQTTLAKRLGVSQARVTTIERNPSAVSVRQLFEILQLLDVQLVLRDLTTQPKPTLPAAESDYAPKGEW